MIDDREDLRDQGGRFAKGGKPGPGRGHGNKVSAYRAAVFNAVSPEDAADVMRAMVEHAKQGDVSAARVVFERLLGAPEAMDVIEKLRMMEEAVREFMSCDVLPYQPRGNDD